MRNPFLVGRSIYLRALETADADWFAQWLNDARVTRTLRSRGPITVEGEREWIARVNRDPACVACALVLKRGDRLIGSTSLFDIDPQVRAACFGIVIGVPAAWGRGYGTEATRLLTDHAFTSLNLNRVWLHVHANNVRGQRAYERAGYRVEGVAREAVYREGVHRDLVSMAILRAEWERARTRAASKTTPGRGAAARVSGRRRSR